MPASYRFDENGNELLPEIKSISWINEYVKMLVEEEAQLQDIYVSAEISNFKHHSTGHMYFTLKDEQSEVRAVMFKSYASKIRFKPENGMKVLIHARIGVYEKAGSYQLYVDSMQPDGLGSLYLEFEQLKLKLSSEGLFDTEHKRPLPKYPEKIGIITSPTGAAIRDIIKVAKKRCPYVKLVLFPSAVQGMYAAQELTRAVEYFNLINSVDLIIIGRGGGSMEDLWAFNDEGLARAIYNSKIPVISAVGHEIDFSISDFVADVRAATPSHAAEIATPNVAELKNRLEMSFSVMQNSIYNKLNNFRNKLDIIKNNKFIKDPHLLFDEKRLQLITLTDEISTTMSAKIQELKLKLSTLAASLNALSPLAVLSRGYSVVYDNEGHIVKNADELNVNDQITVKMANGKIFANVIELKGV